MPTHDVRRGGEERPWKRAVVGFLAAAAVWSGCGDSSPPEPEADGFKVISKPKPASEKPPLPESTIWETPLEDATLEAGRQVWVGTCIQCHSTGLGGAPLIGNRELWGPRLEKGLDTLVAHATQGFYGKKGEMPARGGNADLSDEQVRTAVLFMTSRAE